MKTSKIIQELVIKTVGGSAVNARELHNFLEVKTDFGKWIKRIFEYDFDEGIDYIQAYRNGQRKNTKIYLLSLDCAWEISMMQRTNIGKQVRKSFIECEKQLPFYTPTTFFESFKTYSDFNEIIKGK